MKYSDSFYARIILICIAFIIFTILISVERKGGAFTMSLIFLWLLKGLWERYVGIPTYDDGYTTWYTDECYEVHDDEYWKKRYESHHKNYSTISSWAQKENEIKMNIIKNIKPNMNIVLDDEEKTKKMLEAKKNWEFKPLEVDNNQPRAKEINMNEIEKNTEIIHGSVVTNDIIIIDNKSEIDDIRKNVYDAMIGFMKKKSIQDSIATFIFRKIAFIDIVQETKNVVCYMTDKSVFDTYCLDSNEFCKYVKETASLSNVMLEDYKVVSLDKYFISIAQS